MKINLEEFNKAVALELKLHPDWRYGQVLFNVTYLMYPVFADRIRSTMADPFFSIGMDECGIVNFWIKLKEYLQEME